MFAVAGALAVDCVRQGHPATVHILVDSLGQFVRKFLVPWLKRRGGWVSFCLSSKKRCGGGGGVGDLNLMHCFVHDKHADCA